MAIRSLSAVSAPVNTIRNTDSKNTLNQSGDVEICQTYSAPISTRSRLASIVAMGFIALLVGSSTGCSLTSGSCRFMKKQACLDDFMIGYRNKALAAKAWHCEKHCFKDHCNIRDIQAGYMAGFADVAAGSDGCIPAIAPSEYWGWRYQSADGQAGVNAWFQGFPMGVRAAERNGVGNWGQVRPQGANVPRQKQAVFTPPGRRDATDEKDNPFYEEQYPYEPAPYEPVEDGSDEGDGPSNDPIGDALEEGLEDEPMAPTEVPFEEEAEGVGDAIRDALDAATGDDSAFNEFNDSPDASASIGDAEFSTQASDEMSYTIKDAAQEFVEDVFDGEAAETVESAEAFVSELPFSFE